MSTYASVTLVQRCISTPLGEMLLAASPEGLAGVWFVTRQKHLPPHYHVWQQDNTHPVLQKAQTQLQDYFARQRQDFDLPLCPAWGSAFQRAVWQALQHIPYGQTLTYAEIAQRIGNPKAVRAVGAAVGRNPHSIIVPCHRVMGANGSLTGFAGGLDRKKFLLAHEAVHT